jgi:hypothetical protein
MDAGIRAGLLGTQRVADPGGRIGPSRPASSHFKPIGSKRHTHATQSPTEKGVVVPLREAEIEKVLHRLLAEVVVGVEDRFLGKDPEQRAIEGAPTRGRARRVSPTTRASLAAPARHATRGASDRVDLRISSVGRTQTPD